MREELESEFKQLLEPLFCAEAEFHRRRSGDNLVLVVDWKLKNNSSRPHKRSRKIVLYLSQEFLDDYTDGNDLHRENEKRRIKSVIEARLATFVPEHDEPHGAKEPEEVWAL